MNDRSLGLSGVLGRFAGALVLVLATFNPSGYSFFHWAMHHAAGSTAPLVLAGVVLLIAWVLFLRATMLALGALGVALALAFFCALIWVTVAMGWLEFTNTRALVWILLIVVAAVLTLGITLVARLAPPVWSVNRGRCREALNAPPDTLGVLRSSAVERVDRSFVRVQRSFVKRF